MTNLYSTGKVKFMQRQGLNMRTNIANENFTTKANRQNLLAFTLLIVNVLHFFDVSKFAFVVFDIFNRFKRGIDNFEQFK